MPQWTHLEFDKSLTATAIPDHVVVMLSAEQRVRLQVLLDTQQPHEYGDLAAAVLTAEAAQHYHPLWLIVWRFLKRVFRRFVLNDMRQACRFCSCTDRPISTFGFCLPTCAILERIRRDRRDS